MKSYVLRTGSKFILEEKTLTGKLIYGVIADRDISFEDKELVEVDTVRKRLHFHVGNRDYYVNSECVSVLH